MATFINPFTDFGFKRLFGQEDSRKVLIGFLNALFEGEFVVKDLVYCDKEQLPVRRDGRGVIFDIFCTTTDGDHFNLEMQNKSQDHFEDRVLYYAARGIVRQGKRGDWHYDFHAVYGVYFLNFTQEVLQGACRSDFGIRRLGEDSAEKLQVLSNKLRMVFLQMPIFKKTEAQCETKLDKWMYILKNMETLKEIPWREQEEYFEDIAELANVEAMSEAERSRYENALREYQDAGAVCAHQRNEGMKEGMNKGKSEAQIEIAKSLMLEHFPDEFIAKHTGLSLEVIKKLRGEHV